MSDVSDQYEAFPYPARDPAEEARRLVTGSPSIPQEMDHCLWGGARDWTAPLRTLFAGGGTGDGLVQLAQRLTNAGKPYEIHYLDLSTASRRIAEARIRARGLTGITFHTGSLLDAPTLGQFDYIDCCGVLHHLPEPEAGLRALLGALAPGGGLGFMVYAPLGRSGVYPLQAAFNRLYGHLPPKTKLKAARRVFKTLPALHPFKVNPHLGDHEQSDAGFYDLLLHSQDRAYLIGEWLAALDRTGWSLAAMATPGLYDLGHVSDPPPDLSLAERMTVAEQLRGSLKTHVGYARRASDPAPEVPHGPGRIPHLNNLPPRPFAEAVARDGLPPLRLGREEIPVSLPRESAPLITRIDGRLTVAELGRAAGLSDRKLDRLWAQVDRALAPWGVLHYSRLNA